MNIESFQCHSLLLCEMWKIPKLGHLNDVIRRDNLTRFKVDGDREQAKQRREFMKIALFEQWLIDHLRRIWFFTLYLEHGLK